MQKLPEAKPLIAHFSGAALARMSFAAADASRSSGARAESARDEACVSEVWRASRVSTDHFAVHPPFSTSTSFMAEPVSSHARAGASSTPRMMDDDRDP